MLKVKSVKEVTKFECGDFTIEPDTTVSSIWVIRHATSGEVVSIDDIHLAVIAALCAKAAKYAKGVAK